MIPGVREAEKKDLDWYGSSWHESYKFQLLIYFGRCWLTNIYLIWIKYINENSTFLNGSSKHCVILLLEMLNGNIPYPSLEIPQINNFLHKLEVYMSIAEKLWHIVRWNMCVWFVYSLVSLTLSWLISTSLLPVNIDDDWKSYLADPGFPEGGAPTINMGGQPNILPNISQNCIKEGPSSLHENVKNWTWGCTSLAALVVWIGSLVWFDAWSILLDVWVLG